MQEKKSGKTLVEKLGTATPIKKVERFSVEGDDSFGTLMWRSLMKDCAFYYDAPTINEEIEMQKTIQKKYDGLF